VSEGALAAVQIDDRTERPMRTSAIAMCIAVVVLPVPPFSLPKTMTWHGAGLRSARALWGFQFQFRVYCHDLGVSCESLVAIAY